MNLECGFVFPESVSTRERDKYLQCLLMWKEFWKKSEIVEWLSIEIFLEDEVFESNSLLSLLVKNAFKLEGIVINKPFPIFVNFCEVTKKTPSYPFLWTSTVIAKDFSTKCLYTYDPSFILSFFGSHEKDLKQEDDVTITQCETFSKCCLCRCTIQPCY